ncbi:MAG: beta-lactamase family protein [Clostridiales bacterium]|jgi:CubicO group peptidase (beta-lactamase class C family)|nr:beta-lactamase family protein [Clostridiales bacterium]
MSVLRGATDFFLFERIFHQLSSSVSIALLKNDSLIYEFYGGKKFASANGGGEGITRSTRFHLGTATMLLTGALIVKLMEFGELRLNDRVKRFVPEFLFGDVTVYHLLTHTSGLGFDPLEQPDNYAAKREFYRRLYTTGRPAHPAGSQYAPLPYGYAILADVAERVSGQTLEEFASALFFMPLGMKYTTFSGAALPEDQLVTPWSHRENRFLTELRTKLSTGQSGAYTTVLDLIRFGRMLLSGGEFEGRQIFLESSVAFMLKEITGGKFMRTPVFMIKCGGDVYGCFSKYHSARAVAHTGDLGGILFIDPVHKAVGAALTNSTWVNDASQNYSNIGDILMSLEQPKNKLD